MHTKTPRHLRRGQIFGDVFGSGWKRAWVNSTCEGLVFCFMQLQKTRGSCTGCVDFWLIALCCRAGPVEWHMLSLGDGIGGHLTKEEKLAEPNQFIHCLYYFFYLFFILLIQLGLSGIELIYKTGLDLSRRTFQERKERCQMMFDQWLGTSHFPPPHSTSFTNATICHQKTNKSDLQEVSARLYEESTLTGPSRDGGTLRSCLGEQEPTLR